MCTEGRISLYFQDKLAQVKDARAALEALREEERERKRREAEEAEKLRQRSSSSHVIMIPEFTNFFSRFFFCLVFLHGRSFLLR